MAGTLSKRPPRSAMAKLKPKQHDQKGVYHCSCCGTNYTRRDGNFLKSASKLYAANNGFVPICKDCIEKYYLNDVLPAYEQDEHKAIKHMCALCDWVYSDNAFEMAKKTQLVKGNGTLCSLYSNKVRLNPVPRVDGDSFTDTIIAGVKAANEITQSEEHADQQSEDVCDKEQDIDPNLIKEFGPGYAPDEYEYLDEQLQDWCARYESNTKAMEECLKAICIAQLNMRRAQIGGDSKDAAAAMKSFQDLLNTSKLSPKQNNEDELAQEETFGTLIKKWEDDKPIPEAIGKFKDVDGIKKLVTVFFFGHLCKMFNVKNDYSDMYDEEIGKYTVTKPKIEDSTDDDDQRIDAFFEAAKNHDEKISDEDGDS